MKREWSVDGQSIVVGCLLCAYDRDVFQVPWNPIKHSHSVSMCAKMAGKLSENGSL